MPCATARGGPARVTLSTDTWATEGPYVAEARFRQIGWATSGVPLCHNAWVPHGIEAAQQQQNAICGEGVTLRSGSPCPCPCCSRCCSRCTRTTPHTRARAPLLNTHTRATTRAPRARARQVRVCIEALKPSLQNGGRGFKASMQKVAFTTVP